MTKISYIELDLIVSRLVGTFEFFLKNNYFLAVSYKFTFELKFPRANGVISKLQIKKTKSARHRLDISTLKIQKCLQNFDLNEHMISFYFEQMLVEPTRI